MKRNSINTSFSHLLTTTSLKYNRQTITKIFMFVVVLIIPQIVFGLSAKQRTIVKIGWLGPLTGDVAYYGELLKNVTEMAVEEVNSNFLVSEGIKLEVIYEDDEAKPKMSVSAMRKLINIHKVPLVIQSAISSNMLANAPIAEKNKVVLISPTCSNNKIKHSGDYIFRIWPSDDNQGKVIAEFSFNTLNAKKSALLYINNDYGVGLKNVFVEIFDKIGGTVVGAETFNAGETDFRTQLTKIENKNPSVVFLASHYKEAALVLKQAVELGLKTQFIGGDGCFAPELNTISGGASEGMIVTNMKWSPESKDEIVQHFVETYKEKYGNLPEAYVAAGYDLIKVIALAIKNGGTTSSGIKDALYKIKGYKGVTGNITFDEYGEVIDKEYDVFIVRNGKFKPYNK